MSKGFKFFLIGLSLPFWLFALKLLQENLEKFFYAQISQPFDSISEVKIPPKIQKPKLELEAKSAISLKINKAGREKILFQKNPEEILPIASLTKLMTAVIVLEDENYDLENTWLTISQIAASQENVPIYGNLDSEIEKKFNVEKLLDLMLIYSSNDAAFALAEVIGLENFTPVVEQSSLGGFVEKMNQKARELGLNNTHFVNPTGLDPENLEYFNYSTAKDLVKLAQYIFLNHPLIFEITLKKGPYLIKNGLSDLILPENLNLIGKKTGYTDEAGGCILLVLNNEKGALFFNLILGTKKETRIGEMQKLINWLTL